MTRTKSKIEVQPLSSPYTQELQFSSQLEQGSILDEISDVLLEKEFIARYCLQPGDSIRSCTDAAKFLKTKLVREHSRERFVALWLNGQHQLICYEELFIGSLTTAAVYPREVVKQALHLEAAAVIFSHCHPSGTVQPSSQDRALTKKLKDALALLDVQVLDHIIIGYGNSQFFSFADHHLL